MTVLPPPYQRPPGAEIPAMGFAAVLKSLVKAHLRFERDHSIVVATKRDFKAAPGQKRYPNRVAYLTCKVAMT
jgi:hypothetical protein